MAHTDLPADWPTLPITRRDLLPGVLDFVVAERDRQAGTLWILICDPADRLVSPVRLCDLHELTSAHDRRQHLTALVTMIAEIDGDAGVLAAIGRPGGLSATEDDQDWAAALAEAAAGRVRLLGVHVVTVDGSRPVPSCSRAA